MNRTLNVRKSSKSAPGRRRRKIEVFDVKVYVKTAFFFSGFLGIFGRVRVRKPLLAHVPQRLYPLLEAEAVLLARELGKGEVGERLVDGAREQARRGVEHLFPLHVRHVRRVYVAGPAVEKRGTGDLALTFMCRTTPTQPEPQRSPTNWSKKQRSFSKK